MDKKIIITAAVTGSRTTKEMNPAVPYTPEETIQAALDCQKAGASIVHIHVRDPQTGAPDYKEETFREILEGIREKSDIIVNLTTSGFSLASTDMIDERIMPVYLKPDMCSYDLGSFNRRDKTFLNTPQWGKRAAVIMQEMGVKPEIEVFDVGHIQQANDFIERGLIDDPPYFQLCMGVKWGVGGEPEDLLFMKSKLPKGSLWSVLGVQKFQLPMITMSMILGGHVRVGFEDNIYLKKGVLFRDNAHAVEMAADLAERMGRNVATAQEARTMLGLK